MAVTPIAVRDLMTSNPVAISPIESVENALDIMEEHHVSGLPVVEADGRLVGFVSEGDVLIRESPLQPPLYLTLLGGVIFFESPSQFHQHLQKALGMMVQDVMTARPVSIYPEDSLVHAANLIIERKVHRLPVVDHSQRLIGMLTRHDLVRALKSATFPGSHPAEVA
jgi:CBS domain-containing protein